MNVLLEKENRNCAGKNNSGYKDGVFGEHTTFSNYFKQGAPKKAQYVIDEAGNSLYGSTALCWALAAFSVSSSFTQSVGLFGRGLSPSQNRYLHTGQHKHRINAHRHPCLKWDPNPRSQCLSGRRQFIPQTARPLL
jgi:hypothetical protein